MTRIINDLGVSGLLVRIRGAKVDMDTVLRVVDKHEESRSMRWKRSLQATLDAIF